MTKDEKLQIEYGEYTRILNRIIEALAKMKMSGREFKIILAILRYTYGFQKKENNFTLAFLEEKTEIDSGNIPKVLNRLRKRKILNITKKGQTLDIGFNKYYKEWVPISQLSIIETEEKKSKPTETETEEKVKKEAEKSQKRLEKKSKKTEKSRQNVEKKSTKQSEIKHKENINKTIDADADKKEKKQSKNPDDEITEIKMRWVELSKIQKDAKKIGFISIRNPEKKDKKLDSIIAARLLQYGKDLIIQAIENYHKFMMLPKEVKRWQGHSWNLFQFLKREKDYVVIYADWDNIIFNYCDPEKMKSIEPVKDMTVSKAMSILQYNQTSATMENIIKRMPPEQFIEFKCWLQTKKDIELMHLYNTAIKAIKKQKEGG